MVGVPRLRVLLYGLGPIGLGIADIVLQRGYNIVGAVDTDPAKSGRPLRELLPGAAANLAIASSAAEARGGAVDVVIHSTQSHLRSVMPQLLPLLEAGWNVLSTCEELSYPWQRHPEDAARLDHAARTRGARVLGTGVNPGFVMDLLPVILTMPCREVRGITVTRVVDAGQRRLPLQRKVGAGLTPDEFAVGVAAGRIAHVGLPESAAMIAAAVGWPPQPIEESVEPVLGSDGLVRGLHQVCRSPAIVLDLTMALGAADPRDEIRIDGAPPLHAMIPGGVQGDQATCAIVANTIPRLLAAGPGLLTAVELPPAVLAPR
jgi:hypothetical protein